MEFGLENVRVLEGSDASEFFPEDPADLETPETKEAPDDGEVQKEVQEKGKKEKENVEESFIDPNDLFDDPEEVDGNKDKQEKENADPGKPGGSSPAVYSSIASGLQEEGIFLDLEDTKVEDIKSVEDFAEYFDKQIKARLDEEQRRISNALNAGVEPEDIQRYESSIQFLNKVTDDQISKEGEEGETLRKRIIFQDYVNNGASKEKALRMTELSFKNGTDIEDAREALESNRKYFKESYENLIKSREEERKDEERRFKEQAENLKRVMMSTAEPLEGLKVDTKVRQRAYEVVTKPVYHDKETGEYFTEIQKYQMDNPEKFRHMVGLLYAVTNGFKSLDGVIKGKVTTETRKGLKDLEAKLTGRSVAPDGTIDLGPATGPESSFRLARELD